MSILPETQDLSLTGTSSKRETLYVSSLLDSQGVYFARLAKVKTVEFDCTFSPLWICHLFICGFV